LKAYEQHDPPPKKQKAITPQFLRDLYDCCCPTHDDTVQAHAADLILAAFFFAMRSCEYSKTPTPGKTTIVTTTDVIFRDKRRRILPHSNPDLAQRARYVTITFRDQKNGDRMDTRTQRKNKDPTLCPVLRWASIVQRLRRWFPDQTPGVPVCAIPDPLDRTSKSCSFITQDFMKNLLRDTCRTLGGFATYGFHPDELGNKSVRSGAAMSLFIADPNPTKIMILGRWKSDAFLEYIRPQVLEWTHSLSTEMIICESFMHLSHLPH